MACSRIKAAPRSTPNLSHPPTSPTLSSLPSPNTTAEHEVDHLDLRCPFHGVHGARRLRRLRRRHAKVLHSPQWPLHVSSVGYQNALQGKAVAETGSLTRRFDFPKLVETGPASGEVLTAAQKARFCTIRWSTATRLSTQAPANDVGPAANLSQINWSARYRLLNVRSEPVFQTKQIESFPALRLQEMLSLFLFNSAVSVATLGGMTLKLKGRKEWQGRHI